MESNMRILALGLCVYFFPPLFRWLAARWYPGEYTGEPREQQEQNARVLHTRFWRAVGAVAAVLGAVLLARWWWFGELGLNAGDWLRVLAAFVALAATLGRGGWQIQTWKSKTAVERIDRGMYVLGQLGAAALLVFILTL
jgi:hypothetical protein